MVLVLNDLYLTDWGPTYFEILDIPFKLYPIRKVGNSFIQCNKSLYHV